MKHTDRIERTWDENTYILLVPKEERLKELDRRVKLEIIKENDRKPFSYRKTHRLNYDNDTEE